MKLIVINLKRLLLFKAEKIGPIKDIEPLSKKIKDVTIKGERILLKRFLFFMVLKSFSSNIWEQATNKAKLKDNPVTEVETNVLKLNLEKYAWLIILGFLK